MRSLVPYVSVALIAPLSILLTACGGRMLSKSAAQNLIVGLPDDILNKEGVSIESVGQTGNDAVVETNIRAAFRLEKTRGKWVIRDIRVGQDQWESLSDLREALTRVKTEETQRLLEQVSASIEKYRQKNGTLPSFADYVSLTDSLFPAYLSPLIRLDSWRRPLFAEHQGSGAIRLVSAGPDGKFGTADDIVVAKGATP
jgi:hypothetical protein